MRVRKGERAIAAAAAMAAVGVLGMVTQQAQAANDVWVGNTSSVFNDLNWIGNNPPHSGDSLEFGVAGSKGLILADNLFTPSTFSITGITFDATASPNSFVIGPFSGTSGFTLNGNITDNNINSVETINDPIVLGATSALNVASGGSLVLGGVISDNNSGFGLTIGGLGSVTLAGANSYTGNIAVNSGVLIANLAETTLTSPAFGALGNTTTATARTISINNTGTLQFASSDTMGGVASTGITAALTINAGGLVTNTGGQFNTLGVVNLNGGTLTGTGGAVDGNTIGAMYYLRQAVNVGGTSASTISGSGTNDGYALLSTAAGTTVFTVQSTGAAGADLTVSAPLVNTPTGLGGSLTKSGPGTMLLSGASTFTGSAIVNQGALNISGSWTGGLAMNVNTLGTNAVVNIQPGANITLTQATPSLAIGANATGTGAVYQSGGTVSLSPTTGANLQLGFVTGGYGYYNLSGGFPAF